MHALPEGRSWASGARAETALAHDARGREGSRATEGAHGAGELEVEKTEPGRPALWRSLRTIRSKGFPTCLRRRTRIGRAIGRGAPRGAGSGERAATRVSRGPQGPSRWGKS